MSDFEKQIHNMFDHIWDCDINHPIFDDTVGELMNAVIQCYNNLPSAEPERHGRWINYDSDSEIYDDIKCSNCGRRFTVDSERHYDIGFVVSDLQYCPNCGARMDGEKE